MTGVVPRYTLPKAPAPIFVSSTTSLQSMSVTPCHTMHATQDGTETLECSMRLSKIEGHE